MGADIHFVIEKRNKETGEWVGLYTTENVFRHRPYPADKASPLGLLKDRDYDFFGKLAGVRRDGPDPLGLPQDASAMTRMYLSDDVDLHSHTYMTLHEFVLRKVAFNTDAAHGATRLTGVDPVKDYLGREFLSRDDDEDSILGPNARVVIAFDN